MVFHWWIVLTQIVIFYDVAIAVETASGIDESREKPSQDVKISFGKLLQNIIEVNKKRVDSMKELIRLQDFILTKNKMKLDDENMDSDLEESIRNQNALLGLVNMENQPLRIRRSEQNPDLSQAIKLIILQKDIPKRTTFNKPFHEIISRRSWHDKCNKKAAKVCTIACKRAYKDSCMTYKCSKRAKRTFRKQCRRSCKQKFEADGNSSDE